MQTYSSISNPKVKGSSIPFFAKRNTSPFSKPAIQPRLTIGPVNDPYEREADAVADQVMRMSDTEVVNTGSAPVDIQRKCAACEEEDKVQMKGEHGAAGSMSAPSAVNDVINSGGQSLDTGTRRFMESKFGHDFGNVQVHNDSLAHQTSADMNALAYTLNDHIVFGEGQYQPNTNSGRQLLAHELTHVVQQTGSHTYPGLNSSNAIFTKRKPAVAKIKISKINAPDTPAGINRIIPRKDLPVKIEVTGASAASPVEVSVEGSGGSNGSVTINGVDAYTMTATETIKLNGKDQTEPGNAGNLKLIARQDSKVLKTSNRFSVAAYPSSIGFNFNRILEGNSVRSLPDLLWGAAYTLVLETDSGVAGDCNKTSISENVFAVKHTGFFKNFILLPSDFQNSTKRQIDHHALSAESSVDLKAAIDDADVSKSAYTANQFFRFACSRTAIAENKKMGPKVPVSGFKITREVGKYFFTTKKEGFANNGVAAGMVDDSTVKRSDVI